jgi:hypothetical protein
MRAVDASAKGGRFWSELGLIPLALVIKKQKNCNNKPNSSTHLSNPTLFAQSLSLFLHIQLYFYVYL